MTGTFILSLDTEIAWGTDSENLPLYAHCFDTYRAIVSRLIALLDQYHIPATWAVVGHLFLKPGDSRSLKRAPENWYHAPDVIEAVRAANMPHEIGTHTFSHVYTTQITREMWENDLCTAKEIHEQHGLKMRSLVYPRNQIAYLDMLSKYGIIAYRGVEQSWYRHFPHPLSRPAHLLDRFIGLPPPTYDMTTLRVGEAFVNLPASQFLMAYDGLRAKIPASSRVRQAKIGLERAAQSGQLYHLWFHPFNLGTSDAMFDALEQILAEVVRQRDAGRIQVMTMEVAAEAILNSKLTAYP